MEKTFLFEDMPGTLTVNDERNAFGSYMAFLKWGDISCSLSFAELSAVDAFLVDPSRLAHAIEQASFDGWTE